MYLLDLYIDIMYLLHMYLSDIMYLLDLYIDIMYLLHMYLSICRYHVSIIFI